MKSKTLILLLFLSTTLFAQTNDLVKVVKEGNEKIQSLSSKFSEIQYKKATQKSQDLEGKMYFERSGRLAMLYTQPEGDYSIIDGNVFATKLNGAKNHFNMEKKNPMTELRNSLINSLTGDIQAVADENDATIRASQDKQYYTFSLTRKAVNKQKKREITKLTLRYDKKTFALVYMSIEDGMGNTTTYALQHPQLNVNIPATVYNIKK